jgi:hypothetical protein
MVRVPRLPFLVIEAGQGFIPTGLTKATSVNSDRGTGASTRFSAVRILEICLIEEPDYFPPVLFQKPSLYSSFSCGECYRLTGIWLAMFAQKG